MKRFAIIFVLGIAGLCLAGAPPSKPGYHTVEPPVGCLGYPIGSYLTIEGVREEKDKGGIQTLLVDTISGYKLEEPVGIWIENVELPPGERCVLKGYETGRWIGTPKEVLRATGAPAGQAVWKFQFYFLAKSIDQPKSLKIK
jgi:hypothetical protein